MVNFLFPAGMHDRPGGSTALRGVSKNYGDGSVVTALRGVTLQIKEGEMVAIQGPSGSGKSTLMSIMGLLEAPSAGEVWMDGRPVDFGMPDSELARLRNRKMGFVFQSFHLLPRMSALSNVMVPALYGGVSMAAARERAAAILTALGLADRMRHAPSELSGGERQRVAIARALIMNPDIILADEPTGNLDSKSGVEVLGILKDLHAQGKTVIIITHDNAIAAACDRIISIRDGALV